MAGRRRLADVTGTGRRLVENLAAGLLLVVVLAIWAKWRPSGWPTVGEIVPYVLLFVSGVVALHIFRWRQVAPSNAKVSRHPQQDLEPPVATQPEKTVRCFGVIRELPIPSGLLICAIDPEFSPPAYKRPVAGESYSGGVGGVSYLEITVVSTLSRTLTEVQFEIRSPKSGPKLKIRGHVSFPPTPFSVNPAVRLWRESIQSHTVDIGELVPMRAVLVRYLVSTESEYEYAWTLRTASEEINGYQTKETLRPQRLVR